MALFAVVIPVHAGARTLDRSITSLMRQRFDGELRVVVAVNDDREDTFARASALARLARTAGLSCRVIRTPPGRIAGLRAGDRCLPRAPRLYLDQDALLSPSAVANLAARLAPGTGVHFAVPVLHVAAGQSAVTRAYYRAWSELPYVRTSPVTFGAYAVSAAGRDRWDELPPVHSDDKWVRWHFAPHERAVVGGSSYEVVAPDGFVALVRARCRYDRGNRELRALDPVPAYADEEARHRAVLRTLIAHPRRWPSSAAFLTVHALAAVVEGTLPGAGR